MKKKWLFRLAILIVLCVLVAVVLHRGETSSAGDHKKSPASPEDDIALVRSGSPYIYSPDTRDPFFLDTSLGRTVEPRRHADTLRVSDPPRFILTGAVLDGRKKLAIVQSAAGEVFMLSERDSIRGIIIRRIYRDSVYFTYRDRGGSWAIR